MLDHFYHWTWSNTSLTYESILMTSNFSRSRPGNKIKNVFSYLACAHNLSKFLKFVPRSRTKTIRSITPNTADNRLVSLLGIVHEIYSLSICSCDHKDSINYIDHGHFLVTFLLILITFSTPFWRRSWNVYPVDHVSRHCVILMNIFLQNPYTHECWRCKISRFLSA